MESSTPDKITGVTLHTLAAAARSSVFGMVTISAYTIYIRTDLELSQILRTGSFVDWLMLTLLAVVFSLVFTLPFCLIQALTAAWLASRTPDRMRYAVLHFSCGVTLSILVSALINLFALALFCSAVSTIVAFRYYRPRLL